MISYFFKKNLGGGHKFSEFACFPGFLMNVFFALKGSKLFIIICMFCALLGQDTMYAFTGPLVLWLYSPTEDNSPPKKHFQA